MPSSLRQLRVWLQGYDLFPTSKLAWITCYLLGLDVFLLLLEKVFAVWKTRFGQGLGGWVAFLTFVVSVLALILIYRWLKAKMLWRLRNRLIVTYVFIGVTPVVLLLVLALLGFYLFAGQFATYIITSGIDSELNTLAAVNSALAYEVADGVHRGVDSEMSVAESLRRDDQSWKDREMYAWLDGKVIFSSVPSGEKAEAPAQPAHMRSFRGVVRDRDKLYLRAVDVIQAKGNSLAVLSSEPLNEHLLQSLAASLGEVTLYASGLKLSKVDRGTSNAANPQGGARVTLRKDNGDYVLDTGKALVPTYTVGSVPPAAGRLDRQVSFPTTMSVLNWENGDTSQPVAITVQTRVSKLYDRLFGSLGDFAPSIEVIFFLTAIVFGVIELIALIIGTQLTRTITNAVAQLYDATKHINRGNFAHRIPVKSHDQIATLANSFNSMTASLEQLIEEQKEKQRLQNELVIAQEVQAQLFPRQVSQLESLEVHGFCRPARTVSGDYYDFLPLNSSKLLLAAGDVSGKGISAALLMATIHSAVRAYSLEGIPLLAEPVAVGGGGSDRMLPSGFHGSEVSPSTLLSLLNHQLFESTPSEKYATLFLGIYDGRNRRLTYANGGHLPPILMGADGAIRRLDVGGTVVGLFDSMSYEESSIQLKSGELFLGYSDGVTEPENDFGEFGEGRLIDLLRENRHLPLARISEIVTAAVDDWIGAREQPDDVTLVLARAR